MSKGRYELPDPKCQHKAKGRVQAGIVDPDVPGPHASAYCCDRPDCIDDAKEWATAMTHLPAIFVRFGL